MGPGEKKTAKYLEDNLPADWVVVCCRELLTPAGQSVEVDFIVVGNNCVIVLEEKAWSGKIEGNQTSWIRADGESIRSPISHIDMVARMIRGQLNGVPGIKHVKEHFVRGFVVLSADSAELTVLDPRTKEQVLRLTDSPARLIDFDRTLAADDTVARRRGKISDLISGIPNRPKVPRRIGEYTVLEVLPTVGTVRSFSAQHESGALRVLRVVELGTTLDSAAQTKLLQKRTNEARILDELASSHRAPKVEPWFRWGDGDQLVIPIVPPTGKSLRSDSLGRPARSEEDLWRTAERAFLALAEVHGKDIVHRGIDPDSVWIRPDGEVMFVDFGLARIEQGPSAMTVLLEPGLHEQPFLAPECANNPYLLKKQADVYALAATLVFWASGVEPTTCPSTGQIQDLLRGSLEPDAAAAMAQVLAECMTLEPDQRFSATEAVEWLQVERPVRFSLLKPGQEVDGGYVVEQVLGKGAMGATYLAENSVTGRRVVLKKILRPGIGPEMVRAEYEALETLDSPNLPRVYDAQFPGNAYNLVLEYAEGDTLQGLSSVVRGDLSFCRWVGEQVCLALSELHSRGLVHRDVSPANIIAPSDRANPVKLIDLGLAIPTGQRKGIAGTSQYRAPEVEAGGLWTETCDLYSLAVVLFEMLTGQLPYENDGLDLLKDDLIETSELETQFGEVIAVLMGAASPEPAERPESAREFRDELLEAKEPAPVLRFAAGGSAGKLLDPADAEPEDLVLGLVEILSAQGPLNGRTLYGLYSDAAGVRLDKARTRCLNKAVFRAVNEGHLSVDGPGTGYWDRVISVLGQPADFSATESTEEGDGETPYVFTTQQITENDLQSGQIRIPVRSKPFFPTHKSEIEIDFKGINLRVLYDPRYGPPERSGVLRVPRNRLQELVIAHQKLRLSKERDGVVHLR